MTWLKLLMNPRVVLALLTVVATFVLVDWVSTGVSEYKEQLVESGREEIRSEWTRSEFEKQKAFTEKQRQLQTEIGRLAQEVAQAEGKIIYETRTIVEPKPIPPSRAECAAWASNHFSGVLHEAAEIGRAAGREGTSLYRPNAFNSLSGTFFSADLRSDSFRGAFEAAYGHSMGLLLPPPGAERSDGGEG